MKVLNDRAEVQQGQWIKFQRSGVDTGREGVYKAVGKSQTSPTGVLIHLLNSEGERIEFRPYQCLLGNTSFGWGWDVCVLTEEEAQKALGDKYEKIHSIATQAKSQGSLERKPSVLDILEANGSLYSNSVLKT